jgi:ABC-type antimicrobial peptide transport system permease subunit
MSDAIYLNGMKKQNNKFYCKICDYKCSRRSELERHLGRKKHKKNHEKMNKKKTNLDFICKYCGSGYKHQPSLSRHLKKCKKAKSNTVENHQKNANIANLDAMKKSPDKEKDLEIKDLKIQILEEKLKHKDQIIDILKTKGNTTNNNTQNFDNNTFNTNNISINLYLNEHCKDAMNLTDFVDQIKVQLEDIMYQDRTSSADGLTNIITKQLKDLAPTERPIHCSDQRRQHFYIKEGEEWKQKSGDAEMEKSVRKIQIKQLSALKEWEDQHPNFMDDERLQNKYTKFMEKIMYGCGDKHKMDKNVKEVKKKISQNIMIKDAIADLQEE